ncbi:hypothetical protein [Streptomyces roseolus]|uniref:hypothetical protein n=1 Tax=Streptomyces roseolus TaxID=67358 RepID=UPI0036E15F25
MGLLAVVLGGYCFLVKLPTSTSVRMLSLALQLGHLSAEIVSQGPGGVLLEAERVEPSPSRTASAACSAVP